MKITSANRPRGEGIVYGGVLENVATVADCSVQNDAALIVNGGTGEETPADVDEDAT